MKDNYKIVYAIKDFDEKNKIRNIILLGENGNIRNIELDNFLEDEEWQTNKKMI